MNGTTGPIAGPSHLNGGTHPTGAGVQTDQDDYLDGNVEGEGEEEYYYDDDDDEYDDDDEDDEEYPEEFPIGYTITLSPPPPRGRSRGKANGRGSKGDDEDDEEAGPPEDAPRGGSGSQVLPVADYLTEDWEEAPTDGAEYLFMVRQEARSCPQIAAKPNPYARPVRPLVNSDNTFLKSRAAPTDEWRSVFLNRFRNMRATVAASSGASTLPEIYTTVPPLRDETNWRLFIDGRKRKLAAAPTAAGNAKVLAENGSVEALPGMDGYVEKDEEYMKKMPLPEFMMSLEQGTVLALLSHFTTWLDDRLELHQITRPEALSTAFIPAQLRKRPSSHNATSVTPTPTSLPSAAPLSRPLLCPHYGSWILALLTVLADLLTADDISSLRELARVCRRIISALEGETKPGADDVVRADEREAQIATGWMVIACVTGFWGQLDLWE